MSSPASSPACAAAAAAAMAVFGLLAAADAQAQSRPIGGGIVGCNQSFGFHVGCDPISGGSGFRAWSAGGGSGPARANDGYRLAAYVTAAPFDAVNDRFRAQAAEPLRAAPSARAAKVGRVAGGETFHVMARVRGGDWLLVGRDGVGVGYVRADHVRPAAPRYAAY